MHLIRIIVNLIQKNEFERGHDQIVTLRSNKIYKHGKRKRKRKRLKLCSKPVYIYGNKFLKVE